MGCQGSSATLLSENEPPTEETAESCKSYSFRRTAPALHNHPRHHSTATIADQKAKAALRKIDVVYAEGAANIEGGVLRAVLNKYGNPVVCDDSSGTGASKQWWPQSGTSLAECTFLSTKASGMPNA
jgi:hypothetical protein